ncbi:MAG: TlpA family protein disulfide reductase [Proteobacteria bacterium]|nr:TlpA family protein disulfide reductase [Pseudomonadota bacterium]
MKKLTWLISLFSLLICFSKISFSQEEIIVTVSSDVDVAVEQFPASGQYVLLWLAPEYGFRITHRHLAQKLSEQGIEVWQANITEALFLPQSLTSLKQLNGEYIADLMTYAYKTTGKKIVVAGDSYAAISALRGAHQWQERKHAEKYFVGAVLFSPFVYAAIPPLGLPPEFMPIISATNVPIMIYQAQKSGNIRQFEGLLEKLQQHDNPVYTKYMPDVMGLFYSENPDKAIAKNIKYLPKNIKQMIKVLDKHTIPETVVPLEKIDLDKSGIDSYLKEFKGKNQPITINLKDANGQGFYKKDFKGQVTVVNFWATWCPPCVEEIPSLNRLKKKMSGQKFELISINYAEDSAKILEFMKEVNVEFPVLLDQNGEFAKQWNVITYPSTFVIAPDGKIKYGVNAAIEWDDPEFIKIIKSLL